MDQLKFNLKTDQLILFMLKFCLVSYFIPAKKRFFELFQLRTLCCRFGSRKTIYFNAFHAINQAASST